MPVAEDAPTAADQPLWLVEADDRADARRHRRRPSAQLSARCAISTSPAPIPQGRSGQSTAGATHLIKVAVEAATGKRGHVAVYGTDYDTPDGTGVRDYIHVSDLAAAHVHALEKLIAEPGDEPHHELRLRPRLLGARGARRGRPGHQPARSSGGWSRAAPAIRDALVADNGRILATLPWRPRRDDLDTIVAHALAWERKLAERGLRRAWSLMTDGAARRGGKDDPVAAWPRSSSGKPREAMRAASRRAPRPARWRPPWFLLAQACRHGGDDAGEEAALDSCSASSRVTSAG